MSSPWRFTRTRRTGLPSDIAQSLERIEADARKLEQNTDLTDAGRRRTFSADVLVRSALQDLNKREKTVLANMRERQSEREKLIAAKRPDPASELEKSNVLAMLSLVGEEGRKGLLDRAARGDDVRLAATLLSLPPEVLGPAGEVQQHRIRTYLGIDSLPASDEQRIQSAEITDAHELKALRDARADVVRAGVYEDFAAGGFVPKPWSTLTRDEKNALIMKEGTHIARERLTEESEYRGGMPPNAPTGEDAQPDATGALNA